jgi:hypothetical protein
MEELVLNDSFRYTKQFKVEIGAAWRIVLFLSQHLKSIQLLNKARLP